MNKRTPFPLSSNVGRVNIDPRWFKPVTIAAKSDDALRSLAHIHCGHQFAQRIVVIVQAVKDLREKHRHDCFAGAGRFPDPIRRFPSRAYILILFDGIIALRVLASAQRG